MSRFRERIGAADVIRRRSNSGLVVPLSGEDGMSCHKPEHILGCRTARLPLSARPASPVCSTMQAQAQEFCSTEQGDGR